MSLVITVIVLLILAGISIQMISGEDGILNQASKSRNNIDEAQTLEYIKTAIAASRTTDNDVNKGTLQKELDKFFEQPEIIVISKNDYMIKINDEIYNYSDGEVTAGYELKTANNGIAEGYKNPKIVSCKIYGNSIQEGTPSIDNPVEIQTVGDLVTDTTDTNYGKYKIPIIVSSKNLIDINKIGVKSGYYYDSKGNASDEDKRFVKVGSVRCKPLTQYSLSSNLAIYTIWFYNENTEISRKEVDKNNATFTTPENCNVLRISLRNTSGVADTSAFEWIQLENGENNTLYEPYQTPIATNLYLNEPLRRVENYADYIDLNNKKIIRNIKHIEFDGNEDWSKYVSIDKHYQFIVKDNKFSNSTNLVLSNYYKADKATGGYFSNKDYAIMSVDGSRVRFKDKDISSVDEWKAKLQAYYNNKNPLKVDYVLVSSTEEDIDISDILHTIKGTNVITVDTEIQPSQIEITYYN